MTWSRGGERTGSIRFIVEPGGLRLLYTASGRNGGAKEHIDELVPFVRTTTRFSGQRLWLKCLSCHRRCRVIYGGRYFRCRRCHGLSYQSQREPACDRAIEQANRIRKRLGDDMFSAFEADELPPKPPRMRWKTYHKLERRYVGLQKRWKSRRCGTVRFAAVGG